jgi:hypothetical protein
VEDVTYVTVSNVQKTKCNGRNGRRTDTLFQLNLICPSKDTLAKNLSSSACELLHLFCRSRWVALGV